ncbi:uncharacterized protein LOC126737893 [Anthonomus grandis grandis]|uniref:uncharacterized protein LOC126737893 n=1 Tax=Anthonomus grandis grandis TaxID=2921223 RepID=UPI002165992A|nr:uncharacterized protein LOC126737893 [Anthonomus grandis grandis]
MIFHVLQVCSLMTVLVSGQRWSKAIQSFQPRIGYSTNIVHTKAGSNDLNAESSINVNFPFLKEKAPTKYTQVYAGSRNAPNAQNANFFKVGYNLKFNDNNFNKKLKEHAPKTHKKFENAEVITGRQKKNEKVRAPMINTDLAPEDFVSNAYLRQLQMSEAHKQYSPPIVHKFSPPKTRSYTYSQQDISRPQVQTNSAQEQANLPQKYTRTPTTATAYNYNIQKASKAVQTSVVPQQYTGNNYQTFNHDVALKNSESFDFSNAHGDINIGDNALAASEHYSQTFKHNEESPTNAVTDINNIKLEDHIPKSFKGVKPLPLDTSLLKDPILTTDLNNAPKTTNDQIIPIHFDVRSIQAAMQNEIGKLHQSYYQQNPYITKAQNTLMNEDNAGSYSNNFRTYGQPEPIDASQYRAGWKNNYEEDIYNIVSMRPPPIGPNMRY